MLKKINDVLAGLPMTIAACLCLILSFVLRQLEITLPVDPAWAAILICGIPLLYLSVWRIIHNPGIRKISSALLITIAMFSAIAIGDLFAAGEVGFIMSLGAILEDMTTNRAKKGLHKLMQLTPVIGRRIREGEEEMIPAEEIRCGDVLRILPGETVPVDGEILAGETSIDQSIMTGESLPVEKGIGEEVYCGTINRFGSVDIRATRVGEDSSLQKMIRLVEDAENHQAPMQRIADQWASWLVPLAALIAVTAGIVTRDVTRTVTVFVVFCPCALVLATPTAIMAAIGQATKHGVIIKSGDALERMGKLTTIAFDKTGTLTCGELVVSDVLPFSGSCSEDELLALAASAESRSEHPLGRAVTASAAARNLPRAECTDFQMSGGNGITATVGGERIRCGKEDFLKEQGIPLPAAARRTLEDLQAQGKATILVARQDSCLGVIALTDRIRPETADVIARLNDMGVRTVLLTGDNKRAASYLSDQTGISEIRANLLPAGKVSALGELQRDGQLVCMIGDGVNDAPALKRADVGVAMGSMGSDIAVEAADIALMTDDLSRIPYLKRLSNATVNTIRTSITLSMCINFVAVTLSVLGLLTPTTGALVHNAGSCFVVLIAALLYDRKFE